MTTALLTTKDLSALLRLGRTATYEVTRREDFPLPLQVGGVYRWHETEVLAWLENQRMTERPTRAARRLAEPVEQEPLFKTRPSKRRAA